MKEIKGIIPILATPFTSAGDVDYDGLKKLVRHLIKQDVDGITLFGVASEFHKLSDDEKKNMQEVFLNEVEKRGSYIFSMISITEHATFLAQKRAKEAEEMGASSLMLLPPFFLSPALDDIIHHIKAVASVVSIPIIVQYAPNQTGVPISADVFLEINQEFENIQFIKVENQPPGRYVTKLAEGSNGILKSLVGYAGIQMPDVFRRGAVGVQPGSSFIEIYVELYKLYTEGKQDEFTKLFNRLLTYISYWMQDSELIIKAEKEILKRRGIIESAYCRKPAFDLDEIEIQMIDKFFHEFNEFF